MHCGRRCPASSSAPPRTCTYPRPMRRSARTRTRPASASSRCWRWTASALRARAPRNRPIRCCGWRTSTRCWPPSVGVPPPRSWSPPRTVSATSTPSRTEHRCGSACSGARRSRQAPDRPSTMAPPTRRHALLGASALSAALLLPGCGRLPFLGPAPSSCLGPEEELPEFEDGGSRVPPRARVTPYEPSPSRWFNDAGLAVSPDGALIAAAEHPDRSMLGLTDVQGVLLWDTAEGRVVRRIAGAAEGAIAWHPDGTRLALGDRRHIALVSVHGALRGTLTGREDPRGAPARSTALAFSPGGTQRASTSKDGTVRLCDVGGDQRGAGHILQPAAPAPTALSCIAEGTTLVA